MLALLLAACGGGGGDGDGGAAPTAPCTTPPATQPATSQDPTPPPVAAPPLVTLELMIYENHPTNWEVFDLTPDIPAEHEPDGDYALPDYGDNALFRVSGDGRIWWRSMPDYESP
jgi:hypothetical protein